MLRPARVGGDVGQVDFGLGRGRKLDLRLLGRLFQALKRELVLGQVDALLLLELARQIFDQPHVEVFAAEEGVAVRRLHLEHAVADLEDGHVEGAAAEVVDRDGAGFLLVEAVGERRRSRLVDDAQHLEAGDLAGVLGGLPLGVVEVSGNRDDGLRDRTAKMGLRRLLHFLQDEGGNLRRRILLAVDVDPRVAVGTANDLVGDERHVLFADRIVELPPDQPLDREDRALGIGHRLPLGGLTHETFAVVGERDNGRRRARALRILNHLGRRALHDSDARIGRAKVDANYFRHYSPLFVSAGPPSPKAARPREGFRRSLYSRRLASSGPHLSTRFQPIQRASRPNRPVGAYIGGAF